MFRMPTTDDLSKLDVTKLDLSKFDVTKLDPRRIDLAKLDVRNIDTAKLPRVDLTSIELPTFDTGKLPQLELPVDVERITAFVRDAAYVGIGAAVVVAEKADERRREVTDEVTSQIRKLVGAAR